MSVVVMLSLISSITAFSYTEGRTDVALKIEESTNTTDESVQSVSDVSDTAALSDNSIACLNRVNPCCQTCNIIWLLYLVVLVTICAAILIIQTIILKNKTKK